MSYQVQKTKVSWINRQNSDDFFVEQSEKSGVIKCGKQGARFQDCIMVQPDTDVIDEKIAALQYARAMVLEDCFANPSDIKEEAKKTRLAADLAAKRVTMLEQERNTKVVDLVNAGLGREQIQPVIDHYNAQIEIAKVLAKSA